MRKAVAAGFGAVLLVGAAPAERAGVLKAVTDCRTVTDNIKRLACYDAAVATLDTAAAKKEIVVLDREAVRETRKGLFGFTLPKLPFFSGDVSQKDEQPVEVNTTIRSARSLGHGKWQITLEDGAIWETTDSVTRHDPKPGRKIRIRQGAVTNYFLSIDGDPSVRAKRVG